MIRFDDLAYCESIDTILVCMVDMQGRLMGKRMTKSYFIDHGHEESHCCKYLLATDLMMATPDGYSNTSWAQGYGDYVMKPDLTTLRQTPWLEGTALVLCDVVDHSSPVPFCPRQILKTQVQRLEDMGYEAKAATELEFFVFEGKYDDLRKGDYKNLTPASGVNEDYHILQTTKEEHLMRPIRNHLVRAGVPVETTKGEAETGQAELNIKYAPVLKCAEHHTIAKHAVKEIAWQREVAATFLPKWSHDKVGSSSHVHMSVWKDGANAFYDASDSRGMSDFMKKWLAGLLVYAPDYTVLLAPYVNSYKRFQAGSFAPTKAVWSVDNRTAAFRVVGCGTTSVRVECRTPGADVNPYIALAGLVAAGIRGVKDDLVLPPPITGDAYLAPLTVTPSIPSTLREAIPVFKASTMLRDALGAAVVDHYARCAEWEQAEFDKAVTDWEIRRGFELA